jgi:hypothetical protein
VFEQAHVSVFEQVCKHVAQCAVDGRFQCADLTEKYGRRLHTSATRVPPRAFVHAPPVKPEDPGVYVFLILDTESAIIASYPVEYCI